jgi:cell division septation protein DedD
MAGETQTSTQSGEVSQRFIEFVMMQAQNAALFLGQIPNPKTGQGEVNLELAKMFIDQLAMIQEKTRGNLTNEEATVLRNAISNLQMAYVEVAQDMSKAGGQPVATGPEQPAEPPTEPAAEETAKPAEPISSPPSSESESKKKFTKSYGS